MGVIGTLWLAAASAALFAAMPSLAQALVELKQRRFDRWFEDGVKAYGERIRVKFADAWKRETLRLAHDGALSSAQYAKAKGLLGLALIAPAPTPETHTPASKSLSRSFTVIAASLGLAVGALVALIAPAMPIAASILLVAIASLGFCFALTDTFARIIPNAISALLCVLALGLRLALGQTSELVLVSAFAVLTIGVACAVNALFARKHPGEKAIGGGDVKILAVIIVASGTTGTFCALCTLLCAMAMHNALMRTRSKPDKAGNDKLPLGASLAFSLFIGAITSTL